MALASAAIHRLRSWPVHGGLQLELAGEAKKQPKLLLEAQVAEETVESLAMNIDAPAKDRLVTQGRRTS